MGELFRAMFMYAKNGELIEFEHRSLKMIFGFIKSALDRDRVAYEERCRKNAENGSKGGKKKTEREKGADISYDKLIDTLSPSE